MSTDEWIFFYGAVTLAAGLTFYVHCTKARRDSISQQWGTFGVVWILALTLGFLGIAIDTPFVSVTFYGLALGGAIGTVVCAPLFTAMLSWRLGMRKTMTHFASMVIRLAVSAVIFLCLVAVSIFFAVCFTDQMSSDAVWGLSIVFVCFGGLAGVGVGTSLYFRLGQSKKKVYAHS